MPWKLEYKDGFTAFYTEEYCLRLYPDGTNDKSLYKDGYRCLLTGNGIRTVTTVNSIEISTAGCLERKLVIALRPDTKLIIDGVEWKV